MNFEFTENAWDDFQYWIETDSSIVEKIKDLFNPNFSVEIYYKKKMLQRQAFA